MNKSLIKLFKIEEDLKRKPKLPYTLFCDMDLVLTDFDSRFEHFTNKTPKEYVEEYGEPRFWELIDIEIGEVFWSNMPWMREGKKLWNFIKDYKPIVISAPSRNKVSRTGKEAWVQRELGSNVRLILVPREEKQNFVETNHILIEDNVQTLKEWRSEGGIGIECKNGQVGPVIEQLKELGYE